ncbi:MAG: right-handed parallel beta-helix repeat-containing protein [Patescibacteria group bacterium]
MSIKRLLIVLSATLPLFFLIAITATNADTLGNRLRGKIILQVQSKGEAWYVDPVSGKRFSLGKPEDAFQVMRSQGIGITNIDLSKIPPYIENTASGVDTDKDGLSDALETALGTKVNQLDTDGDGYDDKTELSNGYNPNGAGKLLIDKNFVSKQRGKIFLQVQSRGEAWYVNPMDGQRYFLGRAEDAFAVMRKLGLGISNADIAKVEIVSPSTIIQPPSQPSIPTPPVLVPGDLASCKEIKNPGHYSVTTDLHSSGVPCLYIHDTSQVFLDCKGHAISADSTQAGAVKIENTDNFSVSNCNISGNIGTVNQTGVGVKEVVRPGLHIVNSSHGQITSNTLRGVYVNVFSSPPVFTLHSTDLQVTNNTFTDGYQQSYTSNSIISNNTFHMPKHPSLTDGIASDHGINNQIVNNIIDGGWDSVPVTFDSGGGFIVSGTDNGIFLNYESGDTIVRNTITNIFDTGIETGGLITDSKIENNTITNSGTCCGIGAWYSSSWQRNVVADNIIASAPKMFQFRRIFGLQSNEDHVYFQDNTFSGNTFVSYKYLPGPEYSYSNFEFISFDSSNGRVIGPNDVIVGNNRFTGNNFGTFSPPPNINPKSMVVDGGGNKCTVSTEPAYPLQCQQP